MKKTVFLFSGEGTQSSETQNRLLKQAPSWACIEEILRSKLDLDLEQLWKKEIGRHRCPFSPLLTVVSQICLADLWRQWGYRPDVVAGHSTGELAAAYQAGFYALEEVLVLAYRIGEVASRLDGVMLHGWLPDALVANLPLKISSYNFEDEGRRHVTVSGYAEEMDDFLKAYPQFVKMKLPHPWHHLDYRRFSDQLPRVAAERVEEGRFISSITSQFETRLSDEYWRDWMVKPVDFIQTMRTLRERCGGDSLEIIEIGFHPVLEKCCDIFKDYTYASSMFRGEDDIQWILFQRKKLNQDSFLKKVKTVVDAYQPGLEFALPLAYQGFSSLKFTEFSIVLQPLFPSLAAQDFYRYKTIKQLIERFGVGTSLETPAGRSDRKNKVVICGMSCRFPSSVETLIQFWQMLTSRTDQVRREAGRGASEGGFLNDAASRFDHHYFDISQAEARTMDPQQILALELTEMLWKDAGIDPQALDKKRVGVYIGAWNQEYGGDRSSAYYATGTNPSIIAARISYHYDLRGPSWVSNTACSSSLVAVHYAAKDIEAGRVDWAIAGGVNMLLDEAYTAHMRNSGFLSRDNRCKAFDDSANGYVRAEGGGLVLLVNKALADRFYAELTGSAINQNGGRSQVMTAPHPEAQEELITAACQDAGIAPQEISYIECHGTGTKIGDPIELSAIQNTIARNRTQTCYIGSVKSNIGHLESAAGIAGLIKSVAALNYGIIPPNLHFNQPNRHIDFQAYPIQVVTEQTPIDQQACIGISSFGFGGSNAHIIIKGAEPSLRKQIQPLEIPFTRQRAAALGDYLRILEPNADAAVVEPASKAADRNVRSLIGGMIFNVTGIETIDPDLALFEQGLDSMSATEMIRSLEEVYNIEIEPDVLFDYPLFDQFAEEIEKRVAARTGKEEEQADNSEAKIDAPNERPYEMHAVAGRRTD
ncbi:MAG: acyltransferase domain-containing protein [Desulfobacteraceae bacterium]|nr:MAG: acyltransferase domain-containing protein [Desulfobacteraceae bacterium]